MLAHQRVLTEHRKQAIRYALPAWRSCCYGAGGQSRIEAGSTPARRQALTAASEIAQARSGLRLGEALQSFPTEAARDIAATKALTEVVTKYQGSEEAVIAEFYLARSGRRGKTPEAEKWA